MPRSIILPHTVGGNSEVLMMLIILFNFFKFYFTGQGLKFLTSFATLGFKIILLGIVFSNIS